MDKEKEESLKEKRQRRKMERDNKEWLEGEEGEKETELQKLMRQRHRERVVQEGKEKK